MNLQFLRNQDEEDVTQNAISKQLIKKHKKINADFLKHLKPRYICFIEDGTSLNQRLPKSIKLDIDKFIAKYDFEIAANLKQNKGKKDINYDYKKKLFQNVAFKEVL